ncbi:MAG: Asparagine synthetase [glutamine-hydrolyzing], partial [uncultured Solirubrobacteraceae bacterium]
MCGIAGLVTEGEHVDPATLERMCDAVHHRGPDGAGMHLDGPVALGMRRLAINDLVTGDQPFHSEDGTVTVVGNGEIYNQADLRRQLAGRGHRFVSGSDIEVIVHLWEEYGSRCVDHLRGMFAFALWDARERVLFLARDRVGKKPLLYAHHGGALTFASEMRAMFLDGRIPREVDPLALDAFLACGYVPHHLCAFRHVKKLPPGHSLTWRPGERPRIERYWHLEYGPKEQLGPEEAADEVRRRLLEATKIRLMSDVPIGAFLSGGVDSSAVVAAMAMSTSDVVRTFSASFPGTTVDESVYARAVAQRYGTEHHELEIGPVDASIMPRLAWHFGEPFADPAALPSFQLAELVRRHVKVALNGDGGDETFAGYRRYHQLAMTRPADGLPHPLRAAVAAGLARAAGGTEG